MDYKELIKQLQRVIYEVADSVNRYSDNADEIIQLAATAIETLLTERDSAINDAHYGRCMTCKHCFSGGAPCAECVENFGGYDRWEWRGLEIPAERQKDD